MATTVYETKELQLIDGTTISVRPLKISLLREFLKKFETIADASADNNKSMDILMECVQIAMRQYRPELADNLASIEENIDLPTVYAIVEAASGIKMSDIANAAGI
jgi:inhibitor of KinA sporulation pathway (predicted exonuclease)